MNSAAGVTCQVISSVDSYEGKQGPSYTGGISAETVGARAIWLGVVTMLPESRTKAHFHADHETALYVMHGECELWFGEALERCEIARVGHFIYIPAGVPHVAVNRSPTEHLIVVGARTDASEQESVMLQPDLDTLVPGFATT